MSDTVVMQKERHVIGIQIRTKNLDEADSRKARIGPLWKRFFQETLAERIPNKLPDSAICAVYTDYESDQTGEYSLTVGCEVSSLQDVPRGLVGVTIPAAQYALFPVSSAGPKGIQETWQHVWTHFAGAPRKDRAYEADFEELRFGPGGEPKGAAIYISLEKERH